jgi:hypothetical protein
MTTQRSAVPWTSQELTELGSTHELEVATTRENGALRQWTQIWVVTAGREVYVRTWHRRSTGWYGDAAAHRCTRVRFAGIEAEVEVDDVGVGPPALRDAVDVAYAAKYGPGQMADERTASTTLRLRKRAT